MELLGIFHKRAHMEARGLCDAPYTEKGAHALAARDTATQEGVLACAQGRMRNAAALAGELGLMREERSLARIVLAAYGRWGNGYYEHIEGPVLTAIIDRDRDKLILARDRMGEKRLFYTAEAGCVAFADHPDLLLEAGAARPVIDAGGLRELFALGPARTPGRTPWRDLYALEPGCALIAQGEDLRIRRYFCLEAAEHGEDAEATVRAVREMLERAVDDIVPLRPAAMLSGGIDSTALTALLRQRMDRVCTFSVDYEGNAQHFRGTSFQPERDAPYIKLAVERIGCEHQTVELTQTALAQALEEAVDARGFPGMADVDSSLLLFARAIAPQARFVLSGECGDEVFGGYPWFRDARSLNAEAFPWSGSLELRAGGWISILPAEVQPEEEGALLSDPTPLRDVREAYLQLFGAQSAIAMQNEQSAVECIKENIERHLGENVGMQAILANVYFSANYANTLFKEATGMTIHQYQMQRRLSRAAQLLVDEPEVRVKDIAWRCGFSDASHLINSFRRAYGCSPDKYRRRHLRP